MMFQTYLKDCDCRNGGVLMYEGVTYCRWCRTPYAKGGQMNYEPEHFKASHTTEEKRDWEIVSVTNKASKVTLPYTEPFYPEYWDIHSVRRLSDNEVFSVGDEVIETVTDYK